jgi:hypothetical protein
MSSTTLWTVRAGLAHLLRPAGIACQVYAGSLLCAKDLGSTRGSSWVRLVAGSSLVDSPGAEHVHAVDGKKASDARTTEVCLVCLWTRRQVGAEHMSDIVQSA